MQTTIPTILTDTGLAAALREGAPGELQRAFTVPLTPGREGRELRDIHFILSCTGGTITRAMRTHFEDHQGTAAAACPGCKLLGKVYTAEGHRPITEREHNRASIVVAPGVTGDALARNEAAREARAAAREAAKPRLASPAKRYLDVDLF